MNQEYKNLLTKQIDRLKEKNINYQYNDPERRDNWDNSISLSITNKNHFLFNEFKRRQNLNDNDFIEIKIKPSIILSERQTKGRGTMGKKWISKKGNLFLSIFFDMSKKKIDFKKFAILNAYFLKNILAKNFQIKLKSNGLMIFYLKKKKFVEFYKKPLLVQENNF